MSEDKPYLSAVLVLLDYAKQAIKTYDAQEPLAFVMEDLRHGIKIVDLLVEDDEEEI